MPPPDQTPPHDESSPLEAPPRESVKLAELPPREEESSPAEETFATSSLRLHLDEDEEDVLARHLDRLITDILQQRTTRGWDSNWDMWEDAYFGILPDRQFGQANIHVPITQEVVDTTLAVIEQALFTPTPWIGIQPREVMDVDVVKRREQFLDYGFKVEMHAQERLELVLFDAACLGTGVCWLPWLRETDRIRDEETYDGLSLQDMDRFVHRYPHAEEDYPEIVKKLRAGKVVRLTVEYTEAIHDAPDPTYIPLRDWIVRDTAQWDRLNREPFVGHKLILRWDNLVRLEDEGYYDHGKIDRLRYVLNRESQEREAVAEYEKKPYTISTGIVLYRRPGEKRERRYLVDFERDSRTILRLLAYPLWHNRINYIPFYFQRSRKYVYGIPLAQKVQPQQDEINAIHSLTLDAVAFTSIPMFKALKGVQNDFNPLRDGLYPGKTFYTDSLQAMEQFQISASSSINILLELEQIATRHSELASGAMQNLSGLESANDPTAPATKTIQQTQQSLRRIGKYLTTLASSLVELAFQATELYYQFAPRGKVYRVQGEEGTPVFPQLSRQELRLRVDYYPHGSTATLNPDQEKKDNIEMLTLIEKVFPDLVKDPLKRNELADIILGSAGSSWPQKKGKFLLSAQEIERFRRAKNVRARQEEAQLSQAESSRVIPGGEAARGNGSPLGGMPNVPLQPEALTA